MNTMVIDVNHGRPQGGGRRPFAPMENGSRNQNF